MSGLGGALWGQWGFGGEPVPLANPLLARPSLVWCLDLYLPSSFPITFPHTFNQPPLRVCTGDEYPGGVLGDVLYERRLLEMADVRFGSVDVYGGAQRIEGLTCRLAATSDDSPIPNLHAWVGWEHRGKKVVAHLLDRETGEIAQNVFTGEITAMADDATTVSIAARAFDAATLTDECPRATITTREAPYAPPSSLGHVVPVGAGIGRRLPARCVRAQQLDTTEVRLEGTVDPATDRFTVAAGHNLEHGAGPFRLAAVAPSALPVGLEATRDYWVVYVTDQDVQFAQTEAQARAATPTIVNILSAGPVLLTGGLPANVEAVTDYVVALGNVGVVRVWTDELPSGDEASAASALPTEYEVLPCTYRWGGRWATAVRFRGDPPRGSVETPLTVDVQGQYPDCDPGVVAEFKWHRGFQDDVGGLVATSAVAGAVTTANLVPNQTGFGLGALRFDGTSGLDVPEPDRFTTDQFSVELEWTPRLTGALTNRGLVIGPRSFPAFTIRGWGIYYDETSRRIGVWVQCLSSAFAFLSAVGSVPDRRLCRIALRRRGANIAVFLNGTKVVEETSHTSAVWYEPGPGGRPITLGYGPGLTTPHGDLGYVRFSTVGRTDRELSENYYRMRANPILALRDVCHEAGRSTDAVAWDAAIAAIDTVENGGLRWGGYVTERTALGAVLAAAAPFRDLRYDRSADEHLRVTVATAPTQITAQFGMADEYANLLEPPVRLRASLLEAVQRLVVRFRQSRDHAGTLVGHGLEVFRRVTSVGQPETTLDLPFVDHPVTADIIADFRAKRMRTRDQVIDLVLGHEARQVQLEDVIRVHLPTIYDPIDLHVLQVAKGPTRHTIRGVPVAVPDFTYTPQALPADPMLPVLTSLDLGVPLLVLTDTGNRVLKATVRPLRNDVLRPIGAAVLQWGVVGAATPAEAVDDVTADDDSSYVEGTAGALEMFVPAAPTATLPRIEFLQVTGRLRLAPGGSTAQVYVILETATGPAPFLYWGLWVVSSTSYADFSMISVVNPATLLPWTSTDLLALRLSLYAWSGGPVRCTQLAVNVRQVREVPQYLGFIRWWVRGPSASAPATPTESEDSTTGNPQIEPTTDWTMYAHPLGSAGTWWVWARVYDVLGRMVALVGPQSIVVA